MDRFPWHPSRAPCLIAALVALFLSIVDAFALPSAQDRWQELRSSHFTFFGDANSKTLRAFAARFESLFASLAVLMPGVELRSPGPTDVFVFRDLDSMRPYSKVRAEVDTTHPAGYFRFTPYGDALVVAATEEPGDLEIVFRAYLAHVVRSTFPKAPSWIETGMSETFASLTVTPKRVEIGRPIVAHVALLRSAETIPVRELFAMKRRVEGDLTAAAADFRAESWAVVHYFLVSDDALRPKMVKYLELLARGTPAASAFDQSLGPTTGDLDVALREYVRRPSLAYLTVPLDKLALKTVGEPRPMERKETLYRLGRLLTSLDDSNRPEAEAHFRAALAIDPAHGPSQAGLAWLLSMAKQFDEAAALFESASAHGGEDALTLLFAARNLLAQAAASRGAFDAPKPVPEGIARARRLLERTLELDGHNLEARVSLGATYVYDPGEVSAGIKALDDALALIPPRADILLDLVSLCVRKGDRAKAQAVVDGPLAELGDPETLVAAQERLAFADLAEINAKIAAGDLYGALEILKRSRDTAPTPRLRARFEAEIARVEPVAARNRQVARYNAAVKLVNADDRKGAKAILDALLAEGPDAELRGLVEELLRRTR